MRLAGSEESRYPNAHACDDGWVIRVINSCEVGIKEAAKVFGHLLGGDVFIELLPDAFFIALICFDDAIDRAVNRFDEQFFDFHFASFELRNQPEGAVIVVVSKLVEQLER